MLTISRNQNRRTEVLINDKISYAFISTKNKLTLITEPKYRSILPPLEETLTNIKWTDNAIIKVIGTFKTIIVVGNKNYLLNFFKVPETIPHSIILGENFLKNVDIRLRQYEIVNIEKIKKEL